nr:MAG TPA: hypothetical protein [Caudoviricetes sp.]
MVFMYRVLIVSDFFLRPCISAIYTLLRPYTDFVQRRAFKSLYVVAKFQSTLLSIIRNGFTRRCVSVLQMCFEIFPHCD